MKMRRWRWRIRILKKKDKNQRQQINRYWYLKRDPNGSIAFEFMQLFIPSIPFQWQPFYEMTTNKESRLNPIEQWKDKFQCKISLGPRILWTINAQQNKDVANDAHLRKIDSRTVLFFFFRCCCCHHWKSASTKTNVSNINKIVRTPFYVAKALLYGCTLYSCSAVLFFGSFTFSFIFYKILYCIYTMNV